MFKTKDQDKTSEKILVKERDNNTYAHWTQENNGWTRENFTKR